MIGHSKKTIGLMRKTSRYMGRLKAQVDARNRMRSVAGPTTPRRPAPKAERSA